MAVTLMHTAIPYVSAAERSLSVSAAPGSASADQSLPASPSHAEITINPLCTLVISGALKVKFYFMHKTIIYILNKCQHCNISNLTM